MQSADPTTKTDILEIAIPLFARAGFSSISMRTIAKEVGLTAPTLYHHFPDKQALYIAAMKHAFSSKSEMLSVSLFTDKSLDERLKDFVLAFCKLIHDDPDFHKLIQRELLDGDAGRLQLLAEQVFRDIFVSLTSLSKELDPSFDPHLLAISIIGLVSYHYQTMPLRQYQPGSKAYHNDPDVVAAHVKRLLLQGIKGGLVRQEQTHNGIPQ
ncbi:MAG: TetR family transcriptional regulator [Desulfobulbaceae bacterium]|nr:TetR family transcriptional regulator [Desulfobulbaceae bacterium]